MIVQERNMTSTINQFQIRAIIAVEWINRYFLSTII